MPAFLFTDIENSTHLWEAHKEVMGDIIARHDAIVDEVVEAHGGTIVKHMGDGVFAVFTRGNPLPCAVALQKRIARSAWGIIAELRVRVAIHVGEAEQRGDDYFGPTVNRTARLLAAGWGGQILLTAEAAAAYPLPPGATLEKLGVHLLRGVDVPLHVLGLRHPDLAVRDFPPLRTLSARVHNLPSHPTPFIGRQEEVARVVGMLQEPTCRLVTLMGPGGVGKTRLAFQAAGEVIDQFAHGVYVVSLASLSSPKFLLSRLAETLHFSFYHGQEPRTQLLNYLREKEMLLVMDNFEHVLDGAELVGEILDMAPQVKLLATSREQLRLRGEWRLELQGLPFPDAGATASEDIAGYSAVQLFLQSAHRVAPDYSPTAEDIPAILDICRMVAGMPLGIELAAAWLSRLSCREIAQEIERNLDFLATRLRDVPERHRSLRAVFNYSWELLGREEQGLYRRLSVFRGDFDKQAAEGVARASLFSLSDLIDKSLLFRTASGRYKMLEVLRQYAEEKLDEEPEEKEAVHARLGRHYAEFLHARAAALSGEEQDEALEEIGRELANVRAAWQWATTHARAEELALGMESLFHFYLARSWFQEGQEAFSQAIRALSASSDGEPPPILGMVLARQGKFAYRLGQYDSAIASLQKSLAIFRHLDTRSEIAFSLNSLGYVAYLRGNYEEAKRLYLESLAICRAIAEPRGIARALNNLSFIAYEVGEYEEARDLCEQGLALFSEIGSQSDMALAINHLGNVARVLGNYDEARERYEQSLLINRRLGDRMEIAYCTNNLGNIAALCGDYAGASALYQQSLAIFSDVGEQWGRTLSLNNLGMALASLGAYERASALFQESVAQCREIGNRKGMGYALAGLARTAWEQAQPADARALCEESLTTFRALGDRRGIAQALHLLGSIALSEGEREGAARHLHEALRVAADTHALPLVLTVLVALAELFLAGDEGARAAPLLALVQQHSASEQKARARAADLLATLPPAPPSPPLEEVVASLLAQDV